jgi:hypothetical protein
VGPQYWCPKYLTEAICGQQVYAPDDETREAMNDLLDILERHRPLASNGKHGNLHTPTCGCDEKEK